MEEKVMTDELEATESAPAPTKAELKAQRKAEKKSENKRNKKKKTVITTTYFITVLCLLAGLLAPLFRYSKGADLKSCMMLQYIPSMINTIVKRDLIPIVGWFQEFKLAEGTSEFTFTFLCIIGSVYAVVCVLAIVACIFVFLGSKKRNTSANFALGIEVLTLLVTMTYIVLTAYNIFNTKRNDNEAAIIWQDFNLLIPAAGALLMAIIQTVTSKGSAGVSKVIALIFSAAGLVTLLDLTIFISQLKEPLGQLSALLHCGDTINFVSGLPPITLGVQGITVLFEGVSALLKSGDIVLTISYVAVIALSILTVVNFVLDIVDLWTGKPTKKVKIDGKKVVVPSRNALVNSLAIVRYVLALLLAAAVICISFFAKKGIVAGVYLYVLAVIVFIELVNAAFRTAVANARYKKAINAQEPVKQESFELDNSAFETEHPVYAQETSATYEQPVYEQTNYGQNYEQPATYEQPAYEQPAYEQPVQQTFEQTSFEQPVYEQPVQQEPVVQEVYQPEYVSADYLPDMAQDTAAEPYVEPVVPFHDEPEQPKEPAPVYYYGGDSDEFMDTLTDNEKVEFVELFVKKSKGSVNGVPDYVIHEDNSDFFPAVFVHINRYRSIVSDELMSKMYKQLGKLM